MADLAAEAGKAQKMALAARRGAVTIAADPTMRHYSAETIGLVYERTIYNLVGAGSIVAAGSRIANDPALADVPVDVVEIIMAAAYAHFGRELAAADV